jgi:6-phosphogluconolactonase
MDFSGVKGGGVTTLKYDREKGSFEKLKELVVPEGGPCYISLSPKEDYLLFANYSSSSVAVVKLDDNGLPEKVTDAFSFPESEGKSSHPHMISFDPAGKKVYLTDLGFDRIVIYDFDGATGKLRQAENGIVNFEKGSGPRHFEFNPPGTKMYVICELNSTISVFDVQMNGTLSPVQSLSTLSQEYKGESYCADIHIGEDGKYLYGSNRGENTIAVFSIESDGRLESAGRVSCGGDWPRNFVIDPSGKYLLVANQKSGNIVLFNIDLKSGMPVATLKEYKIDSPACLKF